MIKGLIFRYLAVQFLIRVAYAALALSGILLVFDLLGNIVDVTAHSDHLVKTVLYYMGLRLPSILTLAMPLAVLLAAMTTLLRLVNSHELTALTSAGLTMYTVALILTLAALCPAAANFYLANAVVPDTATRLTAWAKNDYRGAPPKNDGPDSVLWTMSGRYFIKAQPGNKAGSTYKNLTVIEKDTDGLIVNFYHAESATYDGATLHLKKLNALALHKGGHDNRTLAALDIPVHMSVQTGQVESIGEIGVADLWRATHRAAANTSPLYSIWLQRKFAEPFACLIMVLLAMPLAFQQTRHNTLLMTCFQVIGLGFAYFIAERLLLSLGETAVTPPILSVWSPVLVFGVMGWWFLLYRVEKKG